MGYALISLIGNPMIIDSSNINFNSSSSSVKEVTKTESLRTWVGPRPNFEGSNPAPSANVNISDSARQLLSDQDNNTTNLASNPVPSNVEASEAGEIQDAFDEIKNDPKLKLLINIIEAITGKKIQLLGEDEVKGMDDAKSAGSKAPAQNAAAPSQGWGVEYDYHERVYESQKVDFNANGVIKTADGKEINFNINLNMQREYFSETRVSFRAGEAPQMKDPLVINFDGKAAELTQQKFDFDIDGDGKLDKISFLMPGSGFLALDKNGNGVIDDGTELFGTQSGNGFADLAKYDEDGNGWIDENDSIFAKLVIWTKDAQGNDIYSTLFDHNIGAIYLGNASTSFDLKDSSNTMHGQVQSTGIYLEENGKVGTVQQIDLAV